MSSFKSNCGIEGIGGPESESACDRMWLLLSVYSDGETSPDETAEVESHVAQCDTCAAELEMMRVSSGALAALPEVQPPTALRTAILAATVNRPTFASRVAQALRGGFVARPVRYGALATAGAAAALALTLTIRRPSPVSIPVAFTQQPPAVIASAQPEPPEQPESVPVISNTKADAVKRVAASVPHRNTVHVERFSITPERHLVAAVIRKPAVAAHLSHQAGPTVKVASASPSYKVKVPTAKPNRDLTDTPESTDSSPIEVASASGMGVPAKPAAPVVATPEVIKPKSETTRITLVASASAIPVDQIASLATIKDNLRRQRPAWDTRTVAQSIKDRQIRIDLIRGSF